MGIETTQRTLYPFNELSEEAQQKALENLYDINTGDEFWYECVLDDAKILGELLGIDIDNIYFRGFSSQGDGACFTGSYSYKKGSMKAVRDYAPKDETLHDTAQTLQDIQKRHFYGLSASISPSGYYMHEYCTQISVDYDAPNYQELSEDAETDIVDTLRDFMRWVYSQLQEEYVCQTSEEAIKETIDVNAYEFSENGELA